MSTEFERDKLLQLLGYIGLVRDELRMQNWTVVLEKEPHDLEEDVRAHTWQSENYYTTMIQLGTKFFDRDETPSQIVRNVVVHELVHCQHRDISELWEGCTLNNTDVSVAQSQSWDKDFSRFMERFVGWTTDRIEGNITMYLPEKKYRIPEGCFLKGEEHT